jgi:hypothetical protein
VKIMNLIKLAVLKFPEAPVLYNLAAVISPTAVVPAVLNLTLVTKPGVHEETATLTGTRNTGTSLVPDITIPVL